jgi:hypothetical protein
VSLPVTTFLVWAIGSNSWSVGCGIGFGGLTGNGCGGSCGSGISRLAIWTLPMSIRWPGGWPATNIPRNQNSATVVHTDRQNEIGNRTLVIADPRSFREEPGELFGPRPDSMPNER